MYKSKRAVVRYADEFFVFFDSRAAAENSIEILHKWLGKRGLSLSEKEDQNCLPKGRKGFLSFNIRHYAVNNSASGWKLLIKSNKKSVQAIRDELRQIWLKFKGRYVKTIIAKLNPTIRRWCNYYRRGVASETFNKIDNLDVPDRGKIHLQNAPIKV